MSEFKINFVGQIINLVGQPASWSSGNVLVFEAGGLRFKSRVGQIGHSVAHDLPPLQHFFEKSCVAPRCNDAEMGPASSSHASA